MKGIMYGIAENMMLKLNWYHEEMSKKRTSISENSIETNIATI